MRFLTDAQCVEWCQQRGSLLPDKLSSGACGGYSHHNFVIPSDAGQRVQLSRLLWEIADEIHATERLVWIRGWSVWPSGEHMPLFKMLRRALGEERELIEVPGHVVEPSDANHGLSVLVLACLFLWDCWLYSGSGVIIEIHNDEGGTVYEPAGTHRVDRRAVLAPFQVTMSS